MTMMNDNDSFIREVNEELRSEQMRTIWKRFAPEDGYPDGMTFDAEGCVWIAHWGAGKVTRFALDGTLLRCVRLPTSNVSNVCFAGPDCRRLFVTTARTGLEEYKRKAEPLAGALFEIDPAAARGLPSQTRRHAPC